jgi:serine/threonine-protein kinase
MALPKQWRDNWDWVGDSPSGGHSYTHLVRAKEDRHGPVCFLKVLKEQQSVERRERMSREVAAYRTLSHCGIPKLIDTNAEHFDKLDFKLYLVTERVEGPTLNQWRESQQAVSALEAVNLTHRLVEIVDFCHKSDVVHRDIKPDNILLRDGSPADPVLVDFGLSFNADEEHVNDTATNAELGNRFLRLADLSPSSENKHDERSDLTFCGGILLYAITGIVPGVLMDALGRLPHQRPLQREKLVAAIDDENWGRFLGVFDHSFQPVIGLRWSSAAALKQALDQLRKPRPPSATSHERRWQQVQEFSALPSSRTEDELLALIREGIERVDEVVIAMGERTGGTFTRTQTAQHMDLSERTITTLLALAKPGTTPKHWARIQVIVAGDELVFSSNLDGSAQDFYRTSCSQPIYDESFKTGVEELFLDQVLREVNMTDAPQALA